MGNSWACFTPKGVTFTRKPSKHLPNSSPFSSTTKKRTSSSKKKEKLVINDALIQQHALAAALLFHHHQQNGSLQLNRSTSVVYPSPAGPKKLPKSSSSRQRSRTDDSLIQPHQLVNKVFHLVFHWFLISNKFMNNLEFLCHLLMFVLKDVKLIHVWNNVVYPRKNN